MNIDLTQFGGLIAGLMLVGAIAKNAMPKLPNRYIPLGTLILGFVAYLAMTKGWSDPTQYIAAIIAAATATGAHSGIKNLFAIGAKPDATPPTAGTGSTSIPLLLLCGLMAASTPVFVTGCATTTTTEAKVFYTFKDSWTLCHQSYATWTERVVLGKVTPEAEAKADAAWNKYRQSYKTALHIAKGSLDAGIPATLLATQNELLVLIATFSR